MRRRTVIQGLAVAITASLSTNLYAQARKVETTDTKGLMTDLKRGGYVIIFRHGATNRDQADTDPLNYDNVGKQRLLSAKGREVAQQLGAAFKSLGIPLGKIYTSKFNRAVETGKLISGRDVETIIDFTEGGLVATPIENDRRAEALRQIAATIPDAGTNTLIVTHKPNIIDAFGKDWFEVKEGESSIFKPDGSGKAVLIARMHAADWIAAARN